MNRNRYIHGSQDDLDAASAERLPRIIAIMSDESLIDLAALSLDSGKFRNRLMSRLARVEIAQRNASRNRYLGGNVDPNNLRDR